MMSRYMSIACQPYDILRDSYFIRLLSMLLTIFISSCHNTI